MKQTLISLRLCNTYIHHELGQRKTRTNKQNTKKLLQIQRNQKNNQSTKNRKFLWIAKTKNNLRTLHEPNKSKKINKVQRTKNYMEHKNPKIFYELQIQITLRALLMQTNQNKSTFKLHRF